MSGFDPSVGGTRTPIRHEAGTSIPLAPNELGWKDVFRVPTAATGFHPDAPTLLGEHESHTG